ncbi:MAG: hypothetical protein AAF656_02020 [Planctomycetota bacterium]
MGVTSGDRASIDAADMVEQLPEPVEQFALHRGSSLVGTHDGRNCAVALGLNSKMQHATALGPGYGMLNWNMNVSASNVSVTSLNTKTINVVVAAADVFCRPSCRASASAYNTLPYLSPSVVMMTQHGSTFIPKVAQSAGVKQDTA